MRSSEATHDDDLTYGIYVIPSIATVAEALYQAEWEVRKAMGVCSDRDDSRGQRACVEARDLLRAARKAALADEAIASTATDRL